MQQLPHHEIVIIGAGIAGATIANEFLMRGQAVCIIDSAKGPATACSKHSYALAHPHIGKGSPRLLRLTRIAFLLARARWGEDWNQHGVFQPSKKDRVFDREELVKHLLDLELDEGIARVLDAQEAKRSCGLEQNGVWMQVGASLDLATAAFNLLKPHALLHSQWGTQITHLEKLGNSWVLSDKAGVRKVSANKVIIAAAMGSKSLAASMDIRLPLRPVRGQLSIFSVTADDPWVNRLPKTAISGEGYCLPAEQRADGSYRWIVGSSFDEGEDDLAERDSSDQFNREQAKGLLNYPQGNVDSLIKEDGFIGVRCVAGDRLPIIGKLAQRPGIFLATAFGSRGILWSALAAKLICAQVLEEDLALLTRLGLTADLLAALAPARFFAGALAAPSALGALASNSKPILPVASKAK